MADVPNRFVDRPNFGIATSKNSVLAKPRRTVERLTQPGRRALLKATAGLAVAGIGGGVISLDAVAQSGGKTTVNKAGVHRHQPRILRAAR
jgi:hypothetical protein